MDWREVIGALESTVSGAELAARSCASDSLRLEAKIVSGVAASIANALRQGIESKDVSE